MMAGQEPTPSGSPVIQTFWRRNGAIIAILVAFLAIGLAYSIINPLHEATDELRHYRFIRHLIQFDALPIQGELPCSTQAHHPPLFYATAALVTGWIDTGRDVCFEPPGNPFWAYRYWEVGRDNKNQYMHGLDEAFPWRGEALAAHLARMVNLIIGAAAVWFTWATARTIWPHRPALAAGSAALIAFNPMFLYIAGAINNDIIAALAGAAITYACVRLLFDPRGLTWRWGLGLGLLYGMALLSKFNLAAIIIMIEATLIWVAWRRGQWREWIIANIVLFAAAGLLAGWWFIRNQLLYGEPTGFERLTELWGVRDPRDSFMLAISELPYAWTSLWGRFGYGQIPLPDTIYRGLFLMTLVAGLGYVFAFLRRNSSGDAADRRVEGDARRNNVVPALLVLALNVITFFGVLFNYLLVSPAGPMGRFFFPALPALVVLVFYGLALWVVELQKLANRPSGSANQAGESYLAWGVNIALIGLSLIVLFGYLAPAYARPATWTDEATIPNPVEARFDTFVTLRGYDVSPGTPRAGEPVDIELYWEVTGRPPGDYWLFIHLTDQETGALVAQRDTHPGLGNFPSSQWQPGDRFVEKLRLYVPDTAYVPAQATITTGLYAPDGYRLGITDDLTGTGLGDAYQLGAINIDPPVTTAATLPNSGAYNFEGRLRLLGYEYDRRILAPGQPLVLTLFLEAARRNPGDYEIQVRVRNEAGDIVADYQALPQRGSTSAWLPDAPVVEKFIIPLNESAAGQTYSVEIALVEVGSGRRLNLVHPDGRWIDDSLILSPIVIR